MKNRIIALLLFLFSETAFALPLISTISGTASQGQTITISGSGFDNRPSGNGKPILYWNGQTGTQNTDLSISSHNFTSWQSVQIETTTAQQRVSGVVAMVSSDSWKLLAGTDHGAFTQEYLEPGFGPDYSKKIYKAMYRKMGYTIPSTALNKNIKIDRTWAFDINSDTGTNRYPNYYFAHVSNDAANSWLHYVELQSFLDPQTHTFATYTISNNWEYHEVLMQMSSNVDQQDGRWQYSVNNTALKNITNWQCSQSANSIGTPSRDFFWQDQFSNYVSTTIDGNAWRSDIILDYGWNRAMLGDAATYAACTHLEYQPYTSWTATNITLSFNAGSFANGATAYLYILDNSNNAIAAPQQITIGSAISTAANPWVNYRILGYFKGH